MEHFKIIMVLKQAMAPKGGANAQSAANAAPTGGVIANNAPTENSAPPGTNTQSPESSMTEEAVSI